VVTEPLTKPNFAAMAKTAQVDKNVLQSVLTNIFSVIGELLSENNIVEIDLMDMGKFFANNRQVLYDPLNKLKPQAPQGK
jgi:nucleoid DNA-binding protein